MALEIVEKIENGKFEIKNYCELVEKAREIAKPYRTLIVDESNYAACKETRTKLNTIIKALNDNRIQNQKRYMQPFNYGKQQYDDIIEILQEAVDNLKNQIDERENEYKEQKYNKINIIFESVFGTDSLILVEQIMNPKWTNHTYRLETIELEIKELKEQIDKDIETIAAITSGDNFYNLLVEYYETLSLSNAIKRVKDRETKLKEIKRLYERGK